MSSVGVSELNVLLTDTPLHFCFHSVVMNTDSPSYIGLINRVARKVKSLAINDGGGVGPNDGRTLLCGSQYGICGERGR